MEITSFLKVGVAWREYRSKKSMVFSLSMPRLIALEDLNTRIRSASFKSYLVAVFLGQNVMEQSCRVFCTGLLTVKN